MTIHRRAIVSGAAGAVFVNTAALGADTTSAKYGLIAKMTAQPGKRDLLAQILKDGAAGIPGCLSYIVADDLANADLLWVTEVWETRQAHDASTSLPSVREAMTKGRPLIVSFEVVAQTGPVSGVGLGAR